HFVLFGLDAVLVGRSVTHPPLHAAAGHPHGEAGGVVVAAVLVLGVRSAAEFATPDEQRVLEHPPLLEVVDEGGNRLVDAGGVGGQLGLELLVLVPAGIGKLDEPDAGFGEAAGEQALAAEIVGAAATPATLFSHRTTAAGTDAVGFQRRWRFIG